MRPSFLLPLALSGLLAFVASAGSEIGGTKIGGIESSGTSLCSPPPACSNDGVAIKHLSSPFCACACPSGYEGDLCELETPCSSVPSLVIAQACQSGGAVTGTLVSGCGCDCLGTGRGGERCELALEGELGGELEEEFISSLPASTFRKLDVAASITSHTSSATMSMMPSTMMMMHHAKSCASVYQFDFACQHGGRLTGTLKRDNCACDCADTGFEGVNCEISPICPVEPLIDDDSANPPSGSLRWAMKRFCAGEWSDGDIDKYGAIECWDTSEVTNFRSLLIGFCVGPSITGATFNEDLSHWDVSSGTDFFSMFYGASSFKGTGLKKWGDLVSNVEDMTNMFYGADIFDEDITGWVTNSEGFFAFMFGEANAWLENYERHTGTGIDSTCINPTYLTNGPPSCWQPISTLLP